MTDFLLYSLLASILLTLLLNLLPMLFPGAANKFTQRVLSELNRSLPDSSEPGNDKRPRARVLFPWKLMLVASLVLTVLVNLIAAISGS